MTRTDLQRMEALAVLASAGHCVTLALHDPGWAVFNKHTTTRVSDHYATMRDALDAYLDANHAWPADVPNAANGSESEQPSPPSEQPLSLPEAANCLLRELRQTNELMLQMVTANSMLISLLTEHHDDDDADDDGKEKPRYLSDN